MEILKAAEFTPDAEVAEAAQRKTARAETPCHLVCIAIADFAQTFDDLIDQPVRG